jgi:hypothetical protein
MATSARGRQENEELAPMTPGAAIICGVPSGCAEQIIHLRPPAHASPFSHGFKRTESLHVENRLDRSVTQVAAGLYSKGGARGPGYERR